MTLEGIGDQKFEVESEPGGSDTADRLVRSPLSARYASLWPMRLGVFTPRACVSRRGGGHGRLAAFRVMSASPKQLMTEMLPVVYDELHRVASKVIKSQGRGFTLGVTDLLHQASAEDRRIQGRVE